MSRVLASLGAFAAALSLGAVLILVTGGDPVAAYTALFEGAFGSGDSLSETAVKACPLLLCGLAVSVAARTGAWNIGADGQLLAGALAAAWVGPHLTNWPSLLAIPVCLTSAALAGAFWAGIAAWLRVHRNVSEIISTILLNFIALQLVSFLVQGPLMESTGQYPQTDALAPAALLPRLLPPHRIHAGLLVAFVSVVAVHVLLFRTVVGYELRAAGSNREAARIAGIAVDRRLILGMVLSGALAGLAGGVEVSGITRRLYERFSPGWGFTAIAVALLGGTAPAGVAASALLFGALDAGSGAMQRSAGVSSVLVAAVQAAVILLVGTIEARRAHARPEPSA